MSAIELEPPPELRLPAAEPDFTAPLGPPPLLLLAGDVDDDGSEPHICRSID